MVNTQHTLEPNTLVNNDSESLLVVPARSRGGFCLSCSTLDFLFPGTAALLGVLDSSVLVVSLGLVELRRAERLSSLSLALAKSVLEGEV